MSNNLATITSKGQVTIPKSVRDSLGIAEDDQVLFIVEEDRAILIPVRRGSLADLYCALPATRPYPGIHAIREEIGEHKERGEE
jgi:AbrB family looped-hinge helix DNA binding protein